MKKHKKGFTLVEVLLCIGIIGIIAAITVPSLLSSTSSKALQAQRKAFYSRMTQAFAQMKNLKNYNYTYSNAYPAMNLVITGLSKVYKITSVCSFSDTLGNCGIPDTVTDNYSDTGYITYPLNKTNLLSLNSNLNTTEQWGGTDTNTIAFKTGNGESVLLFYNPNCKSKTEAAYANITNSVCVNMIFDLNGKSQAPNVFGEDIGYMTVFYPTDPTVVMPVLYNKEAFNGTFSEMSAKAKEMDLVPPTQEELISILINKDIANVSKTGDDALKLHWSATYGNSGPDEIWVAGITDGGKKVDITNESSTSYPYYLIKK